MNVFTTRGDGIAALTIEQRPAPLPGPTEIVVSMRAAAVNYRDLLVVNGRGHWKPAEPRIPVSDGVGVVTAIGTGVTRWQPGDRVAGIFLPNWIDGDLTRDKYVGPLGGATTDGVLAEQRLFPEHAVVRVPFHLSDAEAATLPVAALTAWHALRYRSRVAPGDTVLIEGTGGVSLFALQFASALGARTIVLSSSDEKLRRAEALGATTTIDRRRRPDWEDAVLAATGGVGVDHVIEVVGGDHLNRALEVVRPSGSISFIGLIAGVAAAIQTYQFISKNVRLHGVETGSREMFEEMNAFISAHGMRPVIDRVVPFPAFPNALHYLESGTHFGKIVVGF